MWFKYPIIILTLFVAALLQISFLPYFNVMGYFPNMIFIIFFTLIFFEAKKEYDLGFVVSLAAGFFLDIILPSYFGISIISLLIVYSFKKIAMHFLKENPDEFSVFYFIPLFLICFISYNSLLYLS